MCADIDSVTQEIEEGTTSLISYGNAIRDIDWEIFDLIQEKISNVVDESDFLIELLSNKKLFNDNGAITDNGMATIGLHGMNYNIKMHQSDKYAKEINDIDDKILSGELDGTSQDVINRRQELLGLQREAILAAESEKNAIRDLVEEGINLELDALQELIDKKNEALNSERELYEYQKKVAEQTKNISSLEKQLASYSGDDSEEAAQRIQQLKVDLESAQQELQETEYDKYISDTQKMLDDLMLEYTEILNTRLDEENLNGLISDKILEVNNNADLIGNTLAAVTKEVGTSVSDTLTSIWSGEGNIKSVLSEYNEKFLTKTTTISTTLDNIKKGVDNLVKSSNDEAGKKTDAPKTTTSAKTNPTGSSGSGGSGSGSGGSGGSSKGDGKPKVGDKVKFISGKYYYDSQGKRPLGDHMLGKEVYITKINKASWATHGYHISTGKTLGKGDLGWLQLKQLQNYATGKKNFSDNEYAWTQENGREFIVRPSDGAILTPIAKGDSVLTSAASNNIWDMANSPADFIKDNLNLGATNVPNNSSVQNNITQHFDNITFSMPNVKDYDEMLSALKDDRRFEKLVTAITFDKMAGKSSLTKGKSIR